MLKSITVGGGRCLWVETLHLNDANNDYSIDKRNLNLCTVCLHKIDIVTTTIFRFNIARLTSIIQKTDVNKSAAAFL